MAVLSLLVEVERDLEGWRGMVEGCGRVWWLCMGCVGWLGGCVCGCG